MSKESNRNRFMSTYSGRALIEKHSLTETGTWEIYGEDPNCDFGGSHHSPRIGTAEGKLTDVIDYAVELGNFWQWGAGGEIKKLQNVVKVDTASQAELHQLMERKRRLEDDLHNLNEQLKSLGA